MRYWCYLITLNAKQLALREIVWLCTELGYTATRISKGSLNPKVQPMQSRPVIIAREVLRVDTGHWHWCAMSIILQSGPWGAGQWLILITQIRTSSKEASLPASLFSFSMIIKHSNKHSNVPAGTLAKQTNKKPSVPVQNVTIVKLIFFYSWYK